MQTVTAGQPELDDRIGSHFGAVFVCVVLPSQCLVSFGTVRAVQESMRYALYPIIECIALLVIDGWLLICDCQLKPVVRRSSCNHG